MLLINGGHLNSQDLNNSYEQKVYRFIGFMDLTLAKRAPYKISHV